jgi:transcriptional regulator with XRE-family HTH domain
VLIYFRGEIFLRDSEERGFGATLRLLREAQSMTQRELAAASGFSYETIRSWEYGRKRPVGITVLKRLIDGLELDDDSAEADQLLGALGQVADLYQQLFAVRSAMRNSIV